MTPPAPEPRPVRRLALSLAVALAVHGLALYVVRAPNHPSFAARRTLLEVALLPAVPSGASDSRPAAPSVSPAKAARQVGAQPMPANVEAELAAPPAPLSLPAATPLEAPPGAARYREAARAIIREEARRAAPPPAVPLDTPEARLARAWNGPPPSEKRLDGGILKITTRWGTTYCLKAHDESNPGGVGERYAIGVTCP